MSQFSSFLIQQITHIYCMLNIHLNAINSQTYFSQLDHRQGLSWEVGICIIYIGPLLHYIHWKRKAKNTNL